MNEEGGFVVVKQEPLEGVDPLENRAETDIDDDEETYLQKMEGDIASMVQVKLECSNDDMDAVPDSGQYMWRCSIFYQVRRDGNTQCSFNNT